MQHYPPPGWYPDPWTAGRSWRWWDGAQWTVADYDYNPAARRHVREQARKAGKWLRALFVGACIVSVFSDGIVSAVLASAHGGLFRTTPDGVVHVSHNFRVAQLALLPVSLVGLALIAIEIWWLLRVGEFAGRSGWPSRRDRTLGAWSFLIPVVNWWFPYQAIRDSYPPGSAHPVLLRWWLWYQIAIPIAGGAVFVAALIGNAVAIGVVLTAATVARIVVAALGWHVVDDVDRAQDEALTA